jgi:hypothetical protein
MQGKRFCFVGDDGERDSLLSSTSRFNLTIEPNHSGFPGNRVDLGQSLSSSLQDFVHALLALDSTLRQLHRTGSLSGHSRETRADTQHGILNVGGHLLQLSGENLKDLHAGSQLHIAGNGGIELRALQRFLHARFQAMPRNSSGVRKTIGQAMKKNGDFSTSLNDFFDCSAEC